MVKKIKNDEVILSLFYPSSLWIILVSYFCNFIQTEIDAIIRSLFAMNQVTKKEEIFFFLLWRFFSNSTFFSYPCFFNNVNSQFSAKIQLFSQFYLKVHQKTILTNLFKKKLLKQIIPTNYLFKKLVFFEKFYKTCLYFK